MFATDTIKDLLKLLPDKPGIYQFFNQNDTIIYIGKAKSLKKRVYSYFSKEKHNYPKINILVRQIKNIKWIVVDTETDALLLENNLIKKYQPKYNVMLKDDKTFPWICIKNERFPRVFLTRSIIKDGSEYYGPYTSVRMVKTMLDLIRQLYPLRTCKHPLTKENILQKKYKVCLEYHINRCKAPCIGLHDEENYLKNIENIRHIIKGNLHLVIKKFQELMQNYADNLEFEKAQIVKEHLEQLQHYKSKSTIVNPKIHNVDVFSIVSDEKYGYINFLKVQNGAIIQAHTVEITKKIDEPDEELLLYGITNIRERFASVSKEILVPIKLDNLVDNITFNIPKIGDKKKLLDLSMRNATFFKLERQKARLKKNENKHTNRILLQLKKDLSLKEMPEHIECFDNSNIQGTTPVAACVVFKNAKPAKKDYRHYNIKTVTGANDFASMEEIVYRRYNRLLEEKKSLPQLIVIDGGKGQLSSAVKSLRKLKIEEKIAIIGIAKKLEEIYFPSDPIPLYLDKTSESLKIIQYLRNEAHRFGITHHRNKRIKSSIKSELTEIKGIGEKTMQQLISQYKSIQNIKKASINDLTKTIGKAKGTLVYNFFKK